jgi:hypothetical protein
MNRYWLFLFYVAISLWIGREFHPFSTFPMYSRFPNWGYTFFLKNEKGDIVFYGKNLSDGKAKNAGYIGHHFYSYMEHYRYTYGDGSEDMGHLRNAGKSMMEMILQREDVKHFNFDTLKLYRRYYYVKSGKINYRDDMIYEQALRP